MYRIGKHNHAHLRRWIWFGVIFIIVSAIVAGLVFGYKLITAAEVEPVLPSAVVHEFTAPQQAERTFDETNFSIKLPEDWRLTAHSDTERYNKYSYQATEKNKDNRWLEVYVDRVPTDLSFNRIMPVFIDKNQIVIATSVSDNCTTLLGEDAKKPSAVTSVPAKWQGVAFNCDVASYTRNVVGVGSPEFGVNLPLTSPNGTKHVYYFVYIDHNNNPDYQILESALESFSAK